MTDEEQRALRGELRTALLAEFGALAIYRRLARRVRERELAELLSGFAEDEERQIADLRALTEALGFTAARRSRRRRALAEALALTAPLVGSRLALRVCVDAEETRARWYAHIGEFLARRGERRFDEALRRMSTLKQLHAHALGAWLANARRR